MVTVLMSSWRLYVPSIVIRNVKQAATVQAPPTMPGRLTRWPLVSSLDSAIAGPVLFTILSSISLVAPVVLSGLRVRRCCVRAAAEIARR